MEILKNEGDITMTVSLIIATITIALIGLTFIMFTLDFLTNKTMMGVAASISLALTVVSMCALGISVMWEISIVL